MKLTVVIPTYNEELTIEKVLKRVLEAKPPKMDLEVVVVDDGSKDRTREILKNFVISKQVKVLYHKTNKGKGAALRTGFQKATGDIILVQDADLEYNPKDYPKLLKPLLNKKTRVVYGSRELSGKNKHSSAFFQAGGRLVTLVTNLLFGSDLTDEPTGYKIFDARLLKELPLKCERFEFCPEVTGLLLLRGEKILEIPISYSARHRKEGKKINALDGFEAIVTLIRVKLFGSL